VTNAEVRVAIVGDNSDLQRSLSQSQSSLGAFGAAVGRIAVAAGVAAAAGLAVLGKASVDAASLAQQSIGATETVFGKYADTVVKQSNRAATALGLSADEYRNNANVLGALLGNQGVAQDKLAGKTRSLVKMGADLAATFGGETTDAVNALASAFKGEFDPLEQYGISIKQSAINTEAMKVAGVETTAAFNDLSTSQQNAAKQTATTNLLTKQAAKSHGAFAKETETLAHQQQVLNAQWDNLKVKLGNAALPAVTSFVKVLNDRVVPAVSDLADKYLPKLSDAVSNMFKGGASSDASRFVDALKDIDWDQLGDSAGDLADTLKELGPAFADIGAEGVNDTLKVFNTLIEFAADHLDLLRKVLPLVVAGYVGLKGAQLLNQAVGKDSLIGGALQLAQTRQLVVANRELAAAIRETGTAQGGMTGTMSGATAGLSKMKVAAGAAAGIGGLGLVAASTQVANDKVSGLMSVLGSAAMGAAAGSVFGPWGTAIGGVVGGLGGLIGQLGKTDTAMTEAKPAAVDYASSLDRVTSAATEATRELVYNQLVTDDSLTSASKLGLSARTMVDAVLGQKDALAQVNSAIDSNRGHVAQWVDQYGIMHTIRSQSNVDADNVAAALGMTTAALQDDIAKQKALTDAVHTYSDAINKLPPGKRTAIKADGIATSIKDVARLAEKYKLTPKQIKTVLEASGVEGTVKRVNRVKDALTKVNETKPDLTRYTTGLNKFAGDMAPTAQRGGAKVGKALAEGTKQGAKVNLDKYRGDVKQGASSAEGAARTGGTAVGAALKSGTLGGISGLMPALSSAVAAAVNAAIAAGKRAARAQSPSKRMYELGTDIGDGLVLGVNAKQKEAHKAGQKLVDKLFGGAGASGGADAIKAGLDKVSAMIDAVVNKRIKDDKKAAKRADAITDSLRKQYDALRRNGKAQEQNTKALDDARSKYTALVDYANSVRSSFVAFGDITQLGRLDSGKVSLTKLLAQLQQRAKDAREFRALVEQLTAQGLSQETIEQLTAAGPETALATARAIASGGQGAVDAIKALELDIAASGGGLGKTLADTFAARSGQMGTDAAAAYVKQLEGQQKRLDATAERMAIALVRKMQQELAAVKATKDNEGKGKQGKQPNDDAVKGGDKQQVSVKLTAQQVSSLERGRAIQLDLDTYRAAGGRARV
jgi:hypothetical protein